MPQHWNDILEIPEARWIVFGTLLLFAVLIAVYVALLFRNMADGRDENDELDLLSEFRNIRDQGRLDDDEYERLKKVVPEHAKHELLRGGEKDEGKHIVEKRKFLTLAEAEKLKRDAASDEEKNDNDQHEPG